MQDIIGYDLCRSQLDLSFNFIDFGFMLFLVLLHCLYPVFHAMFGITLCLLWWMFLAIRNSAFKEVNQSVKTNFQLRYSKLFSTTIQSTLFIVVNLKFQKCPRCILVPYYFSTNSFALGNALGQTDFTQRDKKKTWSTD